MDRLIYCRPSALIAQASDALPGTPLLAHSLKLYGAGTIPIDRTGTIRTPIRTRIVHAIPNYETLPQSLEAICDERARAIIERTEALDARIYCLWSGGIDSTLALISLLKHLPRDRHDRLCVVVSADSIVEYRRFFYEHIHMRFEVVPGSALPSLLGSKHLLVSGEGNDLLFGADIMVRFIADFGIETIHEPYDRTHIAAIFDGSIHNPAITDFYIELLERLLPVAPIPLNTTYDFLWWTNFCLKWQSIGHRMLTYVAPARTDLIDHEYVAGRYFPFFMTEAFELWSLNNHDQKIKDTWESYKWPCKELIFAYTKDPEYRDRKTKHGSLGGLMRYHGGAAMVDSDFTVHRTVDLARYYEPDNDFCVRA